MARSKKSHRSNEENSKERKGPVDYPYVVYASFNPGSDGETLRWLILKFSTPEAAKAHIVGLIGKDEYTEETFINGSPLFLTSHGISISLRDKELHKEVMSCGEETASASPEIAWFKYRTQPAYHADRDGEDDKPERVSRPSTSIPKEPRVRVDKAGLTSANDIAKELAVEGREVRGVLRGMGLTKGPGGWLFDKKTAEEIREKVRKGLKKK